MVRWSFEKQLSGLWVATFLKWNCSIAKCSIPPRHDMCNYGESLSTKQANPWQPVFGLMTKSLISHSSSSLSCLWASENSLFTVYCALTTKRVFVRGPNVQMYPQRVFEMAIKWMGYNRSTRKYLIRCLIKGDFKIANVGAFVWITHL